MRVLLFLWVLLVPPLAAHAQELTVVIRHGLAPFCALLALPTPVAHADGRVTVTLQHASDGGDISGMKMTATPNNVQAGQVTFRATNQSKELVHEVIVVRSKPNSGALPYDENKGEVVEKQISRLGEVSDLSAGQSGSLTVRLTPGEYLLIGNQPNHYKAGMWTRLIVTP